LVDLAILCSFATPLAGAQTLKYNIEIHPRSQTSWRMTPSLDISSTALLVQTIRVRENAGPSCGNREATGDLQPRPVYAEASLEVRRETCQEPFWPEQCRRADSKTRLRRYGHGRTTCGLIPCDDYLLVGAVASPISLCAKNKPDRKGSDGQPGPVLSGGRGISQTLVR
jgi:hypothetical protein